MYKKILIALLGLGCLHVGGEQPSWLKAGMKKRVGHPTTYEGKKELWQQRNEFQERMHTLMMEVYRKVQYNGEGFFCYVYKMGDSVIVEDHFSGNIIARIDPPEALYSTTLPKNFTVEEAKKLEDRIDMMERKYKEKRINRLKNMKNVPDRFKGLQGQAKDTKKNNEKINKK